MQHRLISVIGGTGFIGHYVVRQLAQKGYRIRVIARDPERSHEMKTYGDVGQIVLTSADVTKPKSLEHYLEGSYAVINLTGILFESGKQSFPNVHAKGPERLAQIAKAQNVTRFIHVSSLGVDKAVNSKYARTKLSGEKAVLTAFPDATILRPSVVFGTEDGFFNKFASMAMISPLLPLIGGGNTKFQPVYVVDVAKAIVAALEKPETCGQTYELGGPKVYSFKELMQFLLTTIHRKRCLTYTPYSVANIMGLVFDVLPVLRHLPFLERMAVSRDQVRLLKYDNVVDGNAKTFADLGIHPESLEVVVPTYLTRFTTHNHT
jgi:uncharacterized protein YbjT (DUF2867 family)